MQRTAAANRRVQERDDYFRALMENVSDETCSVSRISPARRSAGGKRITTDILRYGRPAQPALEPVRVEELMRQVADELRQVFVPETIGIELRPGGAPMYVSADRAQLAQVLINLALNARDAMLARGGTLTIRAGHGQRAGVPGRFIHLMVADTGEGIAAEDLPYVFEPLFTTKRSGTGLGLSVVFQIVAAHGAAEAPLPVIFSSGHASEYEIEALLDNPRTAFLMKPYPIQDLLRTIREVVDSKETCDERTRSPRH